MAFSVIASVSTTEDTQEKVNLEDIERDNLISESKANDNEETHRPSEISYQVKINIRISMILFIKFLFYR